MTTTMYAAHVEVDKTDAFDVDTTMDALAAFHPAISQSERGYAAARISLPAENLAQACVTATAVVTAAYGGATPIRCEVMTEKEFAARQGFEIPLPELVSVTEAAEILGVSRQAILQRITAKTLPAEKVGREYVIPRTAING